MLQYPDLGGPSTLDHIDYRRFENCSASKVIVPPAVCHVVLSCCNHSSPRSIYSFDKMCSNSAEPEATRHCKSLTMRIIDVFVKKKMGVPSVKILYVAK